MRVVDWREVPAAVVTAAIAREQAAWLADLHWDLAEAWAPIEPARAGGRLPGFVVFDDGGAVRGWTCFLVNGRSLQVAAIVSPDAATTAALVQAIEQSDEAARADERVWFVRHGAPGLESELQARGLAIGVYEYRMALLDRHHQPGPAAGRAPLAAVRLWRPKDLPHAIDLTARAYAGATDVRAFAPGGTPRDWRDYVGGLVTGVGCGRFRAEASVVHAGADRQPDAFVLTTALAAGTAHLAQVVVAPELQGRGVGRALVEAAMARARELGFHEVSLLVSSTNAAATRLYDGLGFRTTGGFLAAATVASARFRASA